MKASDEDEALFFEHFRDEVDVVRECLFAKGAAERLKIEGWPTEHNMIGGGVVRGEFISDFLGVNSRR